MSGQACVIEWGVRDTLLGYLQRADDFTVETGGGGTFADGLVRLPATRDAQGVVAATGWVRLRAHGGALAVDLVDVSIQDGALWITDPIADPIAGGELARMRLVTVEPDASTTSENVETYTTALAPGADVLFLYNYPSGAAFAPLRVVAVPDAPAPDDSISDRS